MVTQSGLTAETPPRNLCLKRRCICPRKHDEQQQDPNIATRSEDDHKKIRRSEDRSIGGSAKVVNSSTPFVLHQLRAFRETPRPENGFSDAVQRPVFV
mmetsp:Transcript_15013/g.23365  ORF Transcript_15013/g.23365 Transcript_15013/m.23365 type:complete len:98 (-) Transcript_15013:947-1240(-)|eukprot:CAMPEP_0184327888 /NCGR_PEP_ID=MMETSP1049-20130417/143299_1 /TAXON_ID=77928 /ORGANISM="Proteomonas sulcata, Strain CCMP704" /LENGTH=97 /DNA_ID=CAMNT_0026650165 /DNA_START=1179 /DNA_END=1472 /DNA_ORIENTATION=+